MPLFKKTTAQRFYEKLNLLKDERNSYLIDFENPVYFSYEIQIKLMELFVLLFPEIIEPNDNYSINNHNVLKGCVLLCKSPLFEKFLKEKIKLPGYKQDGGKKRTSSVKKTKRRSRK